MSDKQISFESQLDNLFGAIEINRGDVTPSGDIDKNELPEQEKISDHLRNKRYESDTNDRRWLAEWATATVTMWLFFVLIMLLTNSESLHLSDTVLSVLLGTTTLNVLGLSFIVLRGHFTSTK